VRRKKRQIFVTLPVNGKSSAGELTRRDPQLFATSAMAAGAEGPLTLPTPAQVLRGAVKRRQARYKIPLSG
jgi:hypothetical protein